MYINKSYWEKLFRKKSISSENGNIEEANDEEKHARVLNTDKSVVLSAMGQNDTLDIHLDPFIMICTSSEINLRSRILFGERKK